MGRASPSILQMCCEGEKISDVTISLCRSDDSGAPEHCYLKITLENAFITSYNPMSQGGEDIPVEEVALNFQKIKMEFFPEGSEEPEFSGEVEFKPNAFVKGKKILEN